MKEKEKKGEADGSLNIIGRGTEIQGNVTAAGDMRVEGRIKGTITCKARLVLSPEGVIEGNIDAVQATIAGDVKGTVVARQLLHIQETGKVLGDIFTEKLIVQLGAFFSGNCRMGKVEGTTNQALKGAVPANTPVSGKAVEGLKPGNEA
jgi:cytoskeletal protein CcmA (bactofilin family)